MTLANTEFTVVVGEHDRCDGLGENSSEGGQVLEPSQVFEHPDYANFDNDIAILKVTTNHPAPMTYIVSYPAAARYHLQ